MGSNRQLAAIVFADMVGYTSMVQQNEKKARSKRNQLRKSLEEQHQKFDGRIVQYYGDGSLSIFSSAVNAVRCALAIQRDIQRDPDLNLRIGIHLGDIILDAEGAFGDGVNLASRIENLSVSGAVLLSDKVQYEIRNQSDIKTRSLGIFKLRNVAQPVELFVVDDPDLVTPVRSMLPNVKDQFISSVAVLPFLNLSSDPENQYFSDGVAEEILNALMAIDGLKVIARTSSFVFRSTDLDVREIGTKLQVKNVLQGSVRRTDKRVRVTVQLVNTVDGTQIFSEKYEGDLGDIL